MATKNEKQERVVIDLKYSVWSFNHEIRANQKLLPEYIKRALEKAGEGATIVVLTGAAPCWLYMAIGHAFVDRCRQLIYNSPTTGDVEIFNKGAK